ncbi:MAG TPA: polysaccharide biosynthesis/export family protein [Caulobacteraceae bacterium]|nr:polysaccharide biosynthesis/export family protein [Caulobacteraceae bacterium]
MILRLFATVLLLVAALGAATGLQAQTADPATAEYRLGAGDKVRVIVFDEPSLSGEFAVSGSGQVSLPLIGEVNVLGKSVPEFQTEVQRLLLDGYLKNPRVSVEVLNYRPFYILGEVKKPGEYPYTNGLTVMNAVARAEGFTYRANTKKVFIKHAGETKEREATLTSSTVVSPGDTVRIVERFF